MPAITICTDAGHQNQNLNHKGLAAWACYIRTPNETLKYSGIMKAPTRGSSQAELYAIANALHLLAKKYDLSKYHIILYSDNKWAIKNHRNGTIKKNTSKEFMALYNKYLRPHIEAAGGYEARHVKAHLPSGKWLRWSARHYMQDWCDKEVHRIMKVERANTSNPQDKTACVLTPESA